MDKILGQARAIDMLQAALRTGHAHHAYVFHGSAGVGKFTTAKAFAKIILCHDPQTDLGGRVIACGGCASCRLLRGESGSAQNSGVHPDFLVVTKELARFSDDRKIRERKQLTIPVEVLESQFIEPIHRAPQLRHNKVLVIDEAELIDSRGQNLLLKTLEEPPAGMYLILVTASEDKLLPTIRSRCQRHRLRPAAVDEVLDRWLKGALLEGMDGPAAAVAY